MSADSDFVVGSDRRLIAAYEELRSQAVERFQQGAGMAILITRGFRCWMEASGQLLGSPSETGPQKCLESCSPVGLRGEVVALLASILLHKAIRAHGIRPPQKSTGQKTQYASPAYVGRGGTFERGAV